MLQTNASRIRALLTQIRGVEHVLVREARDGAIDAIEITISKDLHSPRLVRDIESALLTGLGVVVDHRIIHIVEGNGMRGKAGAGPGTAGNGRAPGEERVLALEACSLRENGVAVTSDQRVKLSSVRVDPGGDLHCEITVELERGGQLSRASVRDADTHGGRLMAAGRAAIEALGPHLGESTAVALEGIQPFAICDAGGLLALLVIRRGMDRLATHGTAMVDGDPETSAARAVLDALNRSLAGEFDRRAI